jgi:hypothetical protein
MRCLSALLLLVGIGAGAAQAQSVRVVVNGVELTAQQLKRLASIAGPPRSGRYWYDARSGGWGIEGGPVLGQLPPALPFGGPLRAQASRGTSGVFVNGRQLTRTEVAQLRRLGPVYPRRYWLDANGNFGFEGGPALGNLWIAARAQRARTWRAGHLDVGGGSNGKDFYIMGKDFSFSSF